MRRSILALCTSLCLLPTIALAEVVIGEPAPAFDVKDTAGNSVSIDQLKGKPIILEWANFGCPFVEKHYGAKNMQALQKKAAADGVVWISVFSSAKGKEGFMEGPQIAAKMKELGGSPAHIITDPDGTLGRLYEAKTTPHMYVIDKDGDLAYMGAIDDKPTADAADIAGARNYIAGALASLKAGSSISPSSTKAYGCSVKYAE